VQQHDRHRAVGPVLQDLAQLQRTGCPEVDVRVAVADVELDREFLRGRRREGEVQQRVEQRLVP
jgi:hypothetical protein